MVINSHTHSYLSNVGLNYVIINYGAPLYFFLYFNVFLFDLYYLLLIFCMILPYEICQSVYVILDLYRIIL